MPATVYQRLILKQSEFSRKDLRKIANWVNARWKKNNENDPEKIEQTEDDKTFQVFCYPDEMIPDIDKVIIWYFKEKNERNAAHSELLIKHEEVKSGVKSDISKTGKSASAKGSYKDKSYDSSKKSKSAASKPQQGGTGFQAKTNSNRNYKSDSNSSYKKSFENSKSNYNSNVNFDKNKVNQMQEASDPNFKPKKKRIGSVVFEAVPEKK